VADIIPSEIVARVNDALHADDPADEPEDIIEEE